MWAFLSMIIGLVRYGSDLPESCWRKKWDESF